MGWEYAKRFEITREFAIKDLPKKLAGSDFHREDPAGVDLGMVFVSFWQRQKVNVSHPCLI